MSTPSNDGKIIAKSLLQRDVVLGPRDDWTGVGDPKARRTIQNRLNQRTRRKRIRDQAHQPGLAIFHPTVDTCVLGTRLEGPHLHAASTSMPRLPVPTCQPGPESLVQTTNVPIFHANMAGSSPDEIESLARQKYLGSPTADFLLTLIQFNVFRALLQNTYTLGLSVDWLLYEAVSPINTGAFNEFAPLSLRPTPLQRQIQHHPWLDLFPFPGLRENILRVYDTWPGEDELCAALVGWCNSPGTRTGLIVWGEPWDPSGWEATEGFCESFGWVIRDCSELLHATNAWRARRGEECLVFEEYWCKE